MDIPNTHPSTYLAAWDEAVKRYPDSTFLLFRSDKGTWTEWTYSEFDRKVDGIAAKLASLGVGQGQAVHLCLRNSPAFIGVQLACARLRAWMVPVDPSSTARDIALQISRTAPSVGIAAARRADVYRQGAEGQLAQLLLLHEDEHDFAADSELFDEGHTLRRDELSPAEPEDFLTVMFTSGTTSEPKGVILTQANYATLTYRMAELANLSSHHRWFVSLPMFHANAQFYCLAPAIGVGASIALSSRFSASGWFHQAREAGATHASLFAAPIRMILSRTPEDIEPLELTHVWFAQNLSASHYSEFARLAGTRPRQLYGMTETVAIVTRDAEPTPGHKTIGTPVPGRPVLLVDPATLAPVPRGEAGLLLLGGERGQDIFLEYMNRPDANSRSFVTVNGREWFVTGDMVRQEPNGAMSFVGRIDDVTKISGENVSLAEVEAKIAEAPGVEEVAVVAVSDDVRDHAIEAYVVPEDSAQDLRTNSLTEWAEENLAPVARPRVWHRIDELPKTSVGKIRKFKLTR
ncbi:class I adenylate-forming enzyme family protein [Nesterenkonia alkaliphila]|uniref:AMP-binding protein n=1 Tax=Nesterenkonia alkaliphila TaxID=1463631 RepID=A0A7K1UKG1_9MICC|nr:AMP-binding protein [Nesterenkonia alkaliphila]MVT26916.1 AMP-binding protein [Nesterenkonia alkaliphila]GGA00243.1 putative crotonobetaine/carnitine-CoA ligase [Nesterenkonia alkaliphila]